MSVSPKEPVRYIFVAYITLKNGDRIYARDYGLRAFRLAVPIVKN